MLKLSARSSNILETSTPACERSLDHQCSATRLPTVGNEFPLSTIGKRDSSRAESRKSFPEGTTKLYNSTILTPKDVEDSKNVAQQLDESYSERKLSEFPIVRVPNEQLLLRVAKLLLENKDERPSGLLARHQTEWKTNFVRERREFEEAAGRQEEVVLLPARFKGTIKKEEKKTGCT